MYAKYIIGLRTLKFKTKPIYVLVHSLLICFSITKATVLRIRIRRIHMFLDLLDPDSLIRGMDTDLDRYSSTIKQK